MKRKNGKTLQQRYPGAFSYLRQTAKSPDRRSALGKASAISGATAGKRRDTKQEKRRIPVERLQNGNRRRMARGQNRRNRRRPRARHSIAPAPSTVSRIYTMDGSPALRSTLHNTYESFKAASTPLRENGGLSHRGTHEYEYVGDGGRRLRLSGREYLGQVKTGYLDGSLYVGGNRLAAGVWVMTPNALGGRLQLAAKEFLEHKLVAGRVVYVPSVDATIGGQAAMYYNADVGSSTTDLGDKLIRSAATHQSYTPFEVYCPAHMTIHPEDVNKKYLDESSGDERFHAQGLLEVMSVSSIPGTTKYSGIYGTLYFEYDFDFYASSLDDEIDDVAEGSMTITCSASTLFSAYDNLLISNTAAHVNWATFPSGITVTDLVNYCFACTVTATSGSWTTFTWDAHSDTASYGFAVGQTFWLTCQLEAGGSGNVIGNLSTNYVSSGFAVASVDDGPAGQLRWGAASGTPTPGTLTLDVRGFKLIESL